MNVAEFIRECVEQAGGLADFQEPGLVEALAPEALRKEFSGREMLRFALAPEAAVRHPDAIPALPGSHALDVFIQYASGQGRLTRAYPRMAPLRPRSIAPEIVHAMKVTARRVRLPETEATVDTTSTAQFDFIVTLASDEKEESLQSVVVDLWTGRPDPILSRSAAALDVEASGPAEGSRPQHTLQEAYTMAYTALKGWMAPRIARHQALITRRLQDEAARLRLYYGGLLEDLERRILRAEGNERAEALRQKLEATREEESGKIAELGEKYRLRPSARLAAVRLLTYPRLFSSVMLDRRQGSRELELCWDPLIGRLRLPVCESCGAEAGHLELIRDLRLLCSACAAAQAEP